MDEILDMFIGAFPDADDSDEDTQRADWMEHNETEGGIVLHIARIEDFHDDGHNVLQLTGGGGEGKGKGKGTDDAKFRVIIMDGGNLGQILDIIPEYLTEISDADDGGFFAELFTNLHNPYLHTVPKPRIEAMFPQVAEFANFRHLRQMIAVIFNDEATSDGKKVVVMHTLCMHIARRHNFPDPPIFHRSDVGGFQRRANIYFGIVRARMEDVVMEGPARLDVPAFRQWLHNFEPTVEFVYFMGGGKGKGKQ
jgi:hypothetical protein